MACFENGTIVDLATRESVSLPDVRGTTLRETHGTLWITQENDTQDVVLRTGDTWVVEMDGLTILEAQEATTFCVLGRRLETWVAPRPAASAASRVWRHVHEAFAAFFATPARTVPYA
jgi:Protein of unknown function (DUF2917)